MKFRDLIARITDDGADHDLWLSIPKKFPPRKQFCGIMGTIGHR